MGGVDRSDGTGIMKFNVTSRILTRSVSDRFRRMCSAFLMRSGKTIPKTDKCIEKEPAACYEMNMNSYIILFFVFRNKEDD